MPDRRLLKLGCKQFIPGGCSKEPLFKGGKRVEHFQNIVGVASVEVSTSSLVEMSSPVAKKLLKVIVSCKPLS